MDNVKDKLTACFATVFPNLDQAAIPSASASQMAEWDSLVQVNLLSVIGEEFGMDIDFEDFEDATSFQAILDRLRQRGAGA
jgi:acyl carrier protein